MAVAKKEEKAVTEVKVVNEEKVINAVDVFWDGWFNSFKTFQSFQKDVEEKSLQAFESQKEWFKAAVEQLTKLEEESKKLTTQWNDSLLEVLEKSLPSFGVQNLTEWAEKFEEIGNEVEALAFSPSKKTFEALSESHSQLETALKDALEQQQKNRAEVVNAIGGYVDQLKETQTSVINTLGLDKVLVAK